ncbi:MAG: glycosyltransferase [Phycisphaerales bacterium]|nr:glycosyltransferase [Phycisphaerales bacterium]
MTLLTEGGTVRSALDFCTVLARRGHEVTWLTADDTDAPESWKNKEPNCPSIKVFGPLQMGGRLSKKQIAIAAELAKEADVTHIHAMWDLSNPQVAKVCKRTKTPWVLSIHGMLDDWSMSQRKLKKVIYLATAGKILVRDTTVFHTTAAEEKRQVTKWLKHDNISVIPCIVDLAPYQTVPNPQLALNEFGKSENPTALFLSRVHEKKSIETLIDAVVLLKKRGTPVRLFVAGTGEQAYIDTLKLRAEKVGVSDDVIFLGMVVGDLKLSLFAMADVFVLPTQQENFGLVYPEAMLCETPVVGTKGTDIWRELEVGGAIIADRTPIAFADAIEELVSDKELAKTRGKSGRKQMLKWLDTDTVARQCETMYEEAATSH